MTKRRFVLFGGQGSPSIFSPNAAHRAEQDAQSVGAGSILLSRCHAAFLEEISSLDVQSQRILGIEASDFISPGHLLKPVETYHQHPVLQANTIYLCQILRYLTETLQQNSVFEKSFHILQATAGFSSGMIAAAVVARASSLDEFVAAGVEGFRLAFWVAYHSFAWTQSNGHGEQGNPEATMSLTTKGLAREQIEDKMQEVHARVGVCRMEISSILTSGSVSVSGPTSDLLALQEELREISEVTTTFAHVHGWYHGGSQLEPVVSSVQREIDRRDIHFPQCSQPMKPIYSSLDGTRFDDLNDSSGELSVWLARHLLVHCVNWPETSHAIAADIQSILQQDSDKTIEVLGLGPSSGSLFPKFEPQDPRIRCLDVSSFKAGKKFSSQSSNCPNDIAIIGMSVQLPKGENTSKLWETLSHGLNAVQEIPESRFELSKYYTDEIDKPRSMTTRYGAFLEDPFSFDNTFFNISPREAKSMDPQQRILLHTAQEALEDAGYVADATQTFQRATTGCYIGLATGDYTDNLRNDIDTFYPSGTLRAFHSGRISYFYRLSGPSVVTDTACSSSTVSIYQACRAIQNGDCTAAIAGGVNVITSPDMYLGLSRGHFLSPTGNCKPFDAAADGYCRAEGCVLFVLKRLSDAVAEGDRIHGVIKSAQINQSGNSSSITHPHSMTQTDLLKRLLSQANVDPSSISVVEAHGTGTQAGDAREVETLKLVFGQHHSAKNPLLVSSIKGNVGHCEAASGAAGLAKLLLMLRKGEIPRQAGLNSLNPALGDLERSGLVVPRRNMPWRQSRGMPRRAVLNNFGAAGSNASLLLEEWVGSPKQSHKQDGTSDRSSYVFMLTAKSNKALQSSVDRHIEFLAKSEYEASLADMCYTATARRHQYDHRISITCSSKADLMTKLQQHKAAASKPAKSVTSIVFVFTGQGALYSGMGQELMSTYPPFKDIIMSCDRVIQGLGLGCPGLLKYMVCKDETHSSTLSNVEHLMVSQCACIALEYALAKVFMSWGIKPDYVVGHSLGEYAALCVAGVLTLEDTFHVIAARAKMMGEHCLANTTGMLACHMTPKDSQAAISEDSSLDQLSIACLNGPQDCVIGGPLTQLEKLQTRCKARNIRSKLINVPFAFHTSAMDPIMDFLRALGSTIKLHGATIPVISNVDGQPFCKDTAVDYFANHTRQPVRFHDGIKILGELKGQASLHESMFVEMGPHPTLLPMLRDSIPSSSCTYLSTLQKGRDAWSSLTQTLCAISLRKVQMNWREIFTGTSAQVTSLPGHPLEGSKFFIPFKEASGTMKSSETSEHGTAGRLRTQHPLLPWLRTDTGSSDELVFETDMATLGPLISGHDVGGMPICPASVFHELALEAAQSLLEPQKDEVLAVTGMTFSSPLVHSPSAASQSGNDKTVHVHISKGSNLSALPSFKITSCLANTSTVTLHCSGHVNTQRLDANTGQWIRDHALITRQSRYFSGAGKDHMSTFRTKLLYENIFTRVVRYSSEYQSLQYLNVADSNLEGIGSFRVPADVTLPASSGSQISYLAHPVFTDTLLHAAGFVANLAIGSREIGICSGVESIEIAYHNVDYQDTYRIYCSLLEVKGAILADSIALDSADRVVAVIRGMEFKKLQLSTFRQALSRISSMPKPGVREQPQQTSTLAVPQSPATIDRTEDHVPASSHSGSIIQADTGISQMLKDIVVEVGGFAEQDIDYTMSLADLGIDSLMQIEIASKISRSLPVQTGLSHHDLSECETLEEMDNMLLSVLQPSTKPQKTSIYESGNSGGSSSQSAGVVTPVSSTSSHSAEAFHDSPTLPVTLHVAEESRTPLYLFHDGSGQIGMYKRLHDHDRTTYAFFDPKVGFYGEKRSFYPSLVEMAEDYVSMIISKFSHRPSPLIIGGWSFGGVVAYEAARQLTFRGVDVKGLVLIDSPSPINHEPLPASIIDSIIRSLDQSGVTNALKEEFLSNASLLGSYKPETFSRVTGRPLRTVMLRSQDTLDTEALYGVRYDWLSRQEARDNAIVAWENLVGGTVEVLPIPGNHFEPFTEDKIDETAAQLWKASRIIERA
ncbi:polyketide beta-ketoacyl-synthase [Fusarium torreyae]|uniref:Polyketide beta-ketoacyl-synthase n=1 Tax=Fusarium torreyae TaxID=1237075 RepID=A0A9W8VIP5_9HYPO|nr:polyketide beta-ketoacyl-synthase [Fusarium torreyae]